MIQALILLVLFHSRHPRILLYLHRVYDWGGNPSHRQLLCKIVLLVKLILILDRIEEMTSCEDEFVIF